MTQATITQDPTSDAAARHPYVLRYAMPRSGVTEMGFGSLDEIERYLRGKPGIPQKAAGTIEVFRRVDVTRLLLGLA